MFAPLLYNCFGIQLNYNALFYLLQPKYKKILQAAEIKEEGMTMV